MAKQKFGITVKKSENFSNWYTQVLTKGEFLDYYEVKGCYILRPNGYFIWSEIRKWFTSEIEKLEVEECSFPMLIPKAFLEKEKSHISDFSPEVAWITKCGDEDLHEPVAIRPTSETVIYPSFSKWIGSHRDLPLKANQWCNILRWELRGTTPLIRSKEFLWQEGHTAHLRKKEADEEVLQILDLYYRVYKELLAVPVIKGIKTETEKFAGADYSTTVEGFIPESGRGIQAATSHHLGQNFSKMFDVKIQTDSGDSEFVYQNSWGLTTRSLGIAIMIHSDDKGLVLPPRVSKIQVVIVPCGLNAKSTDQDKKTLFDRINSIKTALKSNKIRVHVDDRDNVTVGYKFNHWEIQGVPLRIEIGLKDIERNEICVFKRNTGIKSLIDLSSNLSDRITSILDEIQEELYEKAKAEQEAKIQYVTSFDEFLTFLSDRYLIMTPWCESEECENEIKKRSTKCEENEVVLAGAKSLCIPFESKRIDSEVCIICSKECKRYTLFGRSY
ncbi:hypothetical protein P3W45_001575 [Vairimorpha bombi]|jgi:prolyl-tRNA synthetase